MEESRIESVVMLVIDMQQGLFDGTCRFDAKGVTERTNQLAERVRAADGTVIFIQHDGPRGDILEPETPGWEILTSLQLSSKDPVVRKTACDAFLKTELAETLNKLNATTLIITGCATDFCVDTTLRSASGRGFNIIAASDCHTTCDRPHLSAKTIITHHNFMWENLIIPGYPVRVIPSWDIDFQGNG